MFCGTKGVLSAPNKQISQLRRNSFKTKKWPETHLDESPADQLNYSVRAYKHLAAFLNHLGMAFFCIHDGQGRNVNDVFHLSTTR